MVKGPAPAVRYVTPYRHDKTKPRKKQAHPWRARSVGHLQLNVAGKLLNYWPNTRRWRYDGVTYFGDVETFIRDREYEAAHDQHLSSKHIEPDIAFKAYAPWDWDGPKKCATEDEARRLIQHKADSWVDAPDGSLVCGSRYHLVKL